MDTELVREHAQNHAQAVVSGDLRRAAGDLTDEVRANAGAVMAKLPNPVTDAQVDEVEDFGEECVARIRYRGQDSEVVVESRWADSGGRPKIIDLKPL